VTAALVSSDLARPAKRFAAQSTALGLERHVLLADVVAQRSRAAQPRTAQAARPPRRRLRPPHAPATAGTCRNAPFTQPTGGALRPFLHRNSSITQQKVKDTGPFNGPLSRTTRVGWNQKRKTSLEFTEARDSEWQWHQLGHMQVCTLLQTENHTSTPPLCFLQAGCPSCRPTNSVNALKVKVKSKAIGYFSFHSFKNICDDLSSLDLGIHEARDLA